MRVGSWIAVKIIHLVASILARISEERLVRLARAIATLLSRLDKRRKSDARANLDFVYGASMEEHEKERIIERGYLNLAYNVLDFLRLSCMEEERLFSRIRIEGEEHLQKALKDGRPMVIVTAHYGDWELGSLFVGRRIKNLTIVGRMLKQAALNEQIIKTRERFGITLLDERGALKSLMSALKKGQNVGIVVDQNTLKELGILVDFFGKRARHTHAASILARRFDAYIMPMFIRSSEDYKTHTIMFQEPFKVAKSEDVDRDILEATQRQASVTEAVIRAKPDDWLWFHRRFKSEYAEIYRRV